MAQYEPITLSDLEIEELSYELQTRYGAYLSGYGIGQVKDQWNLGVLAVINRLNKLRSPLPDGTVKVDRNGSTAVKMRGYWHVVRPDLIPEIRSDSYVADWETVYTMAES